MQMDDKGIKSVLKIWSRNCNQQWNIMNCEEKQTRPLAMERNETKRKERMRSSAKWRQQSCREGIDVYFVCINKHNDILI